MPDPGRAGEWRSAFHLTALRNVEGIRRDGLVPYPIRKGPEFPERGIFLWLGRPRDDLDAVGTVMHRAIDHQSLEIALLEVGYRRAWQWDIDNDPTLTHNGDFTGSTGGRWVYHVHRPCMILTQAVPARLIRHAETYDLRRLLDTTPEPTTTTTEENP